MSSGLLNVAILVPVFLFSLCLHEYAHAWMATRLGDPTPSMLGRLTLRPLAHADMLGTLVLPTVCIYYGLPFIGWAKPVPFNDTYFRNRRVGTALVAAAGPASNILLALICTGILAFGLRVPLDGLFDYAFAANDLLQVFCMLMIQINLFLAALNLLPLPPLDGFMILQSALPQNLANRLLRLAPFTAAAFLLLVVFGGMQYLAIPVRSAYHFLIQLAS